MSIWEKGFTSLHHDAGRHPWPSLIKYKNKLLLKRNNIFGPGNKMPHQNNFNGTTWQIWAYSKICTELGIIIEYLREIFIVNKFMP